MLGGVCVGYWLVWLLWILVGVAWFAGWFGCLVVVHLGLHSGVLWFYLGLMI